MAQLLPKCGFPSQGLSTEFCRRALFRVLYPAPMRQTSMVLLNKTSTNDVLAVHKVYMSTKKYNKNDIEEAKKTIRRDIEVANMKRLKKLQERVDWLKQSSSMGLKEIQSNDIEEVNIDRWEECSRNGWKECSRNEWKGTSSTELQLIGQKIEAQTRAIDEQTKAFEEQTKLLRIQFALQQLDESFAFNYRNNGMVESSEDLTERILKAFLRGNGYYIPNYECSDDDDSEEGAFSERDYVVRTKEDMCWWDDQCVEADKGLFRHKLVWQLTNLLGVRPRISEVQGGFYAIFYS